MGLQKLTIDQIKSLKLPPKIYRYTPEEHVKDFIKGTLPFRSATSITVDNEMDKSVMARNVNDCIELFVTTDPVKAIHENDSTEEARTKLAELTSGEPLVPLSLSKTIKSHTDYLVLCCSTRLDLDLFDRFNADHVIEINTKPFIHLLALRINNVRTRFLPDLKHWSAIFGKVMYVDLNTDLTIENSKEFLELLSPQLSGHTAWFVKDFNQFAIEAEFRIAFVPDDGIEKFDRERFFFEFPKLGDVKVYDKLSAEIVLEQDARKFKRAVV
ncbi:MAG: hypothetical protein OXG08_08435 [Gammaproteobacteria bacterium]|nr:hypothetical protein [Gammaproteobacteria bacterium]